MNVKDPLMELKRKQFKNDYKKIENNSKNGEKLNINGIDYRVESINADFEKSVLELRLIHIGEPLKYKHKKEFKAGDKVKLIKPMHHSMAKQVPYMKYYDVVVADFIEYDEEEIYVLGIAGVKDLVSVEYFDLYTEDNRDFTLDELIFIKGNLGSMINRIENEINKEPDYKRQHMLTRKINTIENINNKITKLLSTYY